MIDIVINNRRRYVRHPTSIPVEISDKGEGLTSNHVLKDISRGGLCCYSPTRLEKGHLVSVKFPSLANNRQVNGQVVWCRKCQPQFEVGIEFHTSDDIHTARMCEQICLIEDYRRRVCEQQGRQLTIDEAAREWIAKHAAEFPE